MISRRQSRSVAVLKPLQLAVSLGVVVLFWLIYPGAMVLFASLAGLCYVLAAAGAAMNNRIAIWLAFAFSAVTAFLSGFGVRQFFRTRFDFFAGSFDGASGFYLPPYLFLLIAVGATLVVILHVISWPWMIRPRQRAVASDER